MLTDMYVRDVLVHINKTLWRYYHSQGIYEHHGAGAMPDALRKMRDDLPRIGHLDIRLRHHAQLRHMHLIGCVLMRDSKITFTDVQNMVIDSSCRFFVDGVEMPDFHAFIAGEP